MPNTMVRKDQPLLIDLSSIADQRMPMRGRGQEETSLRRQSRSRDTFGYTIE